MAYADRRGVRRQRGVVAMRTKDAAKTWLDPRRALERIAINAVAILVTAAVVRGVVVGDWRAGVLAAVIFGLVNSFIRPAVRVITCPLYFLTLGLFAFVVNAAMLALTAWIAAQVSVDFRVDGFAAAFVGAALVAIVAWAAALVV